MAWQGPWSGNYMPVGVAVDRGDGTIERSNRLSNYSALPPADSPNPYEPPFARSPPAASVFTPSPPADFEMASRQTTNRHSSSTTLLGDDYFQGTTFQAAMVLICMLKLTPRLNSPGTRDKSVETVIQKRVGLQEGFSTKSQA